MYYTERMIKAQLEIGGLPGELYNVVVAHDTFCLLYRDEGPCTCQPDITISRREDAWKIGPEGEVERLQSSGDFKAS